ncbi:MAG TPA: hypothetical protein VFJ61_02135 [Solirubrobacterales bacterium]|nr:hypothetical protein [Solirubrobacterales bacterium]
MEPGDRTRRLEQGLDHVVRRRILRALHSRPDGEASPVSLAEADLRDEPLSGVAYHARVLESYKLIGLVGHQRDQTYQRAVYASLVEEEPEVLELLAQAEELDARPRTR